MGEVKSITGGDVELNDKDGEYMMVYFDEEGNITPIWTEGLSEPQLHQGVAVLANAVNVLAFSPFLLEGDEDDCDD